MLLPKVDAEEQGDDGERDKQWSRDLILLEGEDTDECNLRNYHANDNDLDKVHPQFTTAIVAGGVDEKELVSKDTAKKDEAKASYKAGQRRHGGIAKENHVDQDHFSSKLTSVEILQGVG